MTTAESIKDILSRRDALRRYLNIESLISQIAEEEVKTENPDFWGDPKEAQKVMKEFHGAIERSFPKSLYIITADQELEDIFGKANRRRKLYNGMIQCTLYMYFGERA